MIVVLGALLVVAFVGAGLSAFLLVAMAADLHRTGKYW